MALETQKRMRLETLDVITLETQHMRLETQGITLETQERMTLDTLDVITLETQRMRL